MGGGIVWAALRCQREVRRSCCSAREAPLWCKCLRLSTTQRVGRAKQEAGPIAAERLCPEAIAEAVRDRSRKQLDVQHLHTGPAEHIGDHYSPPDLPSSRPVAMASLALRPALRQATARSVLPAFRFQHLAQRSPIVAQTSGFQTSSRRAILPPLPQKIKGTVNDAYEAPEPHPQHGSYHWTFDRIVSIGVLPLTVAPFAAGSLSPLLDSAFISLLIIHTYTGFQNVITDYLPKWRVPRWRKAFEYANMLAVLVVGWGYYEFETNDVGLTEAIRKIWKAPSEKREA